eukprot:Awhi_evm1s13679
MVFQSFKKLVNKKEKGGKSDGKLELDKKHRQTSAPNLLLSEQEKKKRKSEQEKSNLQQSASDTCLPRQKVGEN